VIDGQGEALKAALRDVLVGMLREST